MEQQANFRFYGSLNDFLHRSKKEKWIKYTFDGLPAVKDAIEAIGVPHPEVDVVLINNLPVQFFHPLEPGAQVEVYPYCPDYAWPEGYSNEPKHATPDEFILDVHLGKLAKALRMLGFNTCYQNDFSDETIAQIAKAENRIVLTRDIGLLKRSIIERGYWLRSQHLEEQLAEIIHRYRLEAKYKPFERCLACNEKVKEVEKEEVWNQLPPKTRLYFKEFFQCPSCKRVYWKGSHYERMQQFIENLKG